VAKETSSVCGCRWGTLWTQDVTFIIYDILYRHFKTQLFEILLFFFSKHWFFCWVQCVLCATFCNSNYITPYKEYLWNMQLQTTSPESKFPNEYTDVIFIQIDQHLRKLLQKYKGVPILWITVYYECSEVAQCTFNIGTKVDDIFGWPWTATNSNFRRILRDFADLGGNNS